jgi:di/tricarboxylate transporter
VLAAGNTNILIVAFMCSAGMGLPISSFPNINAISVEDATGVPWLEVIDFIQVGSISSVITLVAVMSIGYFIMATIGFN